MAGLSQNKVMQKFIKRKFWDKKKQITVVLMYGHSLSEEQVVPNRIICKGMDGIKHMVCAHICIMLIYTPWVNDTFPIIVS